MDMLGYIYVCVCVMSEICSSKMNLSIKEIVYSIDFHIGVGLKTKSMGDIFQFSYI